MNRETVKVWLFKCIILIKFKACSRNAISVCQFFKNTKWLACEKNWILQKAYFKAKQVFRGIFQFNVIRNSEYRMKPLHSNNVKCFLKSHWFYFQFLSASTFLGPDSIWRDANTSAVTVPYQPSLMNKRDQFNLNTLTIRLRFCLIIRR